MSKIEKIKYEYYCEKCNKSFGSSLEEPAACPVCGRLYGISGAIKKETIERNVKRKLNPIEIKALSRKMEKDGCSEELYDGKIYIAYGKEELFYKNESICSSRKTLCIDDEAEFTSNTIFLPIYKMSWDGEGDISDVEPSGLDFHGCLIPHNICFTIDELFQDVSDNLWHLVSFLKKENKIQILASDTMERLLDTRDKYLKERIMGLEGWSEEESKEEIEWVKRNGADDFLKIDETGAEIIGIEVIQLVK